MKEKSGDKSSHVMGSHGKPLEDLGTGLIHVSEIPLGNYVENEVTWAQCALAPSLECSMALSANSAAWPGKPLQSGGLQDWAP